MATQRAAADGAAQILEIASRDLAVNPMDADFIAAHNTASQAVAVAQAGLAQSRNALFNLATSGLSSALVQHLLHWAVACEFSVPAEFRVLELGADQWALVEGALRAERRSLRMGQPLDPALGSLLASIWGNPDVIAASQRLQQHLSSVEATFEE